MSPDFRPEIDRKVIKIAGTRPNPDPAVGPWAAYVTAVVRAAQCYEGNLIARVVPAALAAAPHLNVATQVRVTLPQRVLEAVEQGVTDIGFEYAGDGPTRKLDCVVCDARNGRIEFVECKRGLHQIGADHQRARQRDDRALELIGRSYARSVFRMVATSAHALTLSYYGNTGLPEHQTLRAAELDDHYGWPVQEVVDKRLAHFRRQLNLAVPGLTGMAA